MIEKVYYNIPFFKLEEQEISGLDCFWILQHDVKSEDDILKMQYNLIKIQTSILEMQNELNLNLPVKIKDKEIQNMAKENQDRIKNLIQKLGFDPRDESWIENSLATNEVEKKWFAFERKNPFIFNKLWKDMTEDFNKFHSLNISIAEAKNLSKKRTRFLLGSYITRQSGNSNQIDWINSAKQFEQEQREIENRMLSWSLNRNNSFPLCQTLKPITFTPGPYFHQCIEKIPHVFTDTSITKIKPGVVLQVVSYDPVKKYIKLEFTKDVQNKIRSKNSEQKAWEKDETDYNIWLQPNEVESSLKILEKLA